MKLQSLAVIFVIIILPISLVMSEYVQLQLDSVVLMASYDAKLNDATYDAVRAYQLNEQNSTNSGVNNEKVRDIQASINSFYASLSNSLGTEGYTEDDLKPYVPAIVYTLYDGYYIYGPYRKKSNDVLEYGIKPFISYSEKYEKDENNSVVINYTLDNYITVYGKIGGEYIQKGGFLVDPKEITIGSDTVTVGNITISEEILSELSGYDVQMDDDIPDNISQSYKYVNTWKDADELHDKMYISRRTKITKGNIDGDESWVVQNPDKSYGKYTNRIQGYDKIPQQDRDEIEKTDSIKDESAILYYKSAKEFSEWVSRSLSWIKIPNSNSAEITYSKANTQIFGDLTDIENENSVFNIHRKEVIRKSIESNLRAAIESYNSISQAVRILDTFKMPKLTEQDWDKILNNISVISFLQNIVTKNNYQKYSGYCVLTNNQNKDYVDPTQIYIYDEGEKVAHRISCEKVKAIAKDNIRAYKNTDFLRQNVFDNQGMIRYYYKHNSTFCYDCLVNTEGSEQTNIEEVLKTMPNDIRNAYYTALAREKYNVNMPYKTWAGENSENVSYEDETFEIVLNNQSVGYMIIPSDGNYIIKNIYYSKNGDVYTKLDGNFLHRNYIGDGVMLYAVAEKDGKLYKSNRVYARPII